MECLQLKQNCYRIALRQFHLKIELYFIIHDDIHTSVCILYSKGSHLISRLLFLIEKRSQKPELLLSAENRRLLHHSWHFHREPLPLRSDMKMSVIIHQSQDDSAKSSLTSYSYTLPFKLFTYLFMTYNINIYSKMSICVDIAYSFIIIMLLVLRSSEQAEKIGLPIQP